MAILPQLTETIVVHEDTALGSTATQTCVVESRHSPASQINSSMQWGNHNGLDEIKAGIENAYLKVVSWKSNIFSMPKNAIGKEAIKEQHVYYHSSTNQPVGGQWQLTWL